MRQRAPLRRPRPHAQRQRRAPPMRRLRAAWRRVRWRQRRLREPASAQRVAPLRRLWKCKKLLSGARSLLPLVSMGPLAFMEVTAAEKIRRPALSCAEC